MSVADIDAGETITVGEVTYEQTNAGFIKKGETDQILDVEGWTAEDFTYNFEDSWKNIVYLGEDNTISLDADTTDTIYLSSDSQTKVAEYIGGSLTALDESASDVTVAVTNSANSEFEIGSGFGKVTTTSADSSGTYSPLSFWATLLQAAQQAFRLVFGGSGAAAVEGVNAMTVEEGTVSVEAGAEVTVLRLHRQRQRKRNPDYFRRRRSQRCQRRRYCTG